MYSPVKRAVTAALLKVLEVWMPSQLMCAAAFGQGGATVRFTNVFSNTYACVAASHFLVEVVSSSRSSTACLQWRCRICGTQTQVEPSRVMCDSLINPRISAPVHLARMKLHSLHFILLSFCTDQNT